MAKTIINVKGNTATIEGDKNSFVAKLLAANGGKLKLNARGVKRELTIVSGEQPLPEPEIEEPIEVKPKKSRSKKK